MVTKNVTHLLSRALLSYIGAQNSSDILSQQSLKKFYIMTPGLQIQKLWLKELKFFSLVSSCKL